MFPWNDPPEPLRCDRFMAAALHDPERGYYTRRIRQVGRRGDFSTVATISPALGRGVARWARTALAETRCRDLIELGPGDGSLSAAVLAGLSLTARWRTRLHLVERSEALREVQRKLLGNRVGWHDSAVAALEACGGKACLFSNEFLDAFPARRFKRDPEGWRESWILPGQERWLPGPALPRSSVFDLKWPEGQVVDVHDAVRDWLVETLPRWRLGRMLTSAYGAEAADLYQRRPGGSLRGYFHHQVIEGDECFTRAGHQDLTCDVNFTDLVAWSAPWTRTTRLATQAGFLADHVDPLEAADRIAVDVHGAGGSFLVWEAECRA